MTDILSGVTVLDLTRVPAGPAPALGKHTERVLREMLGMGEGEIGELRKEKAI